jgi:hypothetical protein
MVCFSHLRLTLVFIASFSPVELMFGLCLCTYSLLKLPLATPALTGDEVWKYNITTCIHKHSCCSHMCYVVDDTDLSLIKQ